MLQIGTLVRIKKDYDIGCGSLNYRFHFTKAMLKQFGGKVLAIEYAKMCPTYDYNGDDYFEDDNCEYRLKDPISNKPIPCVWASSMFEIVQPVVSIF